MPRSLLHDGPSASAATAPVLAKGFRPFFLLGALHAAIFMPLWVLALRGVLPFGGFFDATTTHAHELLFGLTLAVIAGFLLTAVGNWTKKETATGGVLAWLVALWLAGRIAVPLGSVLPRAVVAVAELAFLPALIVVLARPILTTKNRRNYVMLGVLTVLSVADLAMVLEGMGVLRGVSHRALTLSVDVVVTLIVVMSARVFPMFTRNVTKIQAIRNVPALDRLTLAAALAWAGLDTALEGSAAAAVAAGALLVAVVARSATWGVWAGRRDPLIAVLHAGTAFLVLGLGLKAVSPLAPAVPPSAAVHALTVGVLALTMLGMMARVGLGHTGRSLAAPRSAVLGFALLGASAIVRVAGPFFPSALGTSYAVAGGLFSLAFVLFVIGYAGVLTSPRVDGKPG